MAIQLRHLPSALRDLLMPRRFSVAVGLAPVGSSSGPVLPVGRTLPPLTQGTPPGWPPDPGKNEARTTVDAVPGLKVIGQDDSRDYASRSTATQAQHERIIAALTKRPHNTFELRALGVMQVSARIFELRAMDHKIVTIDRVSARDEEGIEHGNVAVYALVGGKEVAS